MNFRGVEEVTSREAEVVIFKVEMEAGWVIFQTLEDLNMREDLPEEEVGFHLEEEGHHLLFYHLNSMRA